MRLIDADKLKAKLQEHHDFFVNAYDGFKNLPPNDKARVDEITHCISEIVNAPTVEPCYQTTSCLDCKNYDKEKYYCPRFCKVIREIAKENQRPQGKWIKVVENLSWHYECNKCHNRPLMARLVDEDVLSEFCPNCGADMRGKEE